MSPKWRGDMTQHRPQLQPHPAADGSHLLSSAGASCLSWGRPGEAPLRCSGQQPRSAAGSVECSYWHGKARSCCLGRRHSQRGSGQAGCRCRGKGAEQLRPSLSSSRPPLRQSSPRQQPRQAAAFATTPGLLWLRRCSSHCHPCQGSPAHCPGQERHEACRKPQPHEPSRWQEWGVMQAGCSNT